MGLTQLITAVKAKVLGTLKARRLKSLYFSGTPVLIKISVKESGRQSTWSLVFKNGLMLTLGEAGILDYQDREFGNYVGGEGESAAPDNREFLVQLHKLVLKSLLRFITQPGLPPQQRERAAEAASKLWLATESQQFSIPTSGIESGSWIAGFTTTSEKNPHPLR